MDRFVLAVAPLTSFKYMPPFGANALRRGTSSVIILSCMASRSAHSPVLFHGLRTAVSIGVRGPEANISYCIRDVWTSISLHPGNTAL